MLLNNASGLHRWTVAFLLIAILLAWWGLIDELLITRGGFWLRVLAFGMLFPMVVVRQRRWRQRLMPMSSWVIYFIPAAALCLGLLMLLSWNRGAPASDSVPILAERAVYNFTRVKNVERWRFVAVEVIANSWWTVLVSVMAVELAFGPSSRESENREGA